MTAGCRDLSHPMKEQLKFLLDVTYINVNEVMNEIKSDRIQLLAPLRNARDD